MSGNSLRKLPTLWLDSRDDGNDVGAIAGTGDSAEVRKNTSKNDWVVIMGNTSRETSPERNERRDCTLGTRPERERKDYVQSPRHSNRHGRRSCFPGRRNRPMLMVSCCLPSTSVTYIEIGSGRGIGDCGLLLSRGVIFSALGISAGISFAMRDNVPAIAFLTELFMWLHALHLLLIPFLLLASLMAANRPLDEYEEAEEQRGISLWTIVNVASHVVSTFSQAELIRLFVLNAVPSLQPTNVAASANSVYSLRSVFAFQRYLMAGYSITELLFSKAPQHFFYTLMVLFVSACWEICMYRIRVLEKTVGSRVGLLIGSVALVVNLSVLNVIIQNVLVTCGPEPSRRDDDHARITDIL